MDLPKVLVIDDDKSQHEFIAESLEGAAQILSAKSLLGARKLFSENRDAITIVMDGFLPEDTLELTTDIRKSGYTGPIIAASGNTSFQSRQIRAGCSHKSSSTSDVVDRIQSWLTDPTAMEAAWAQSGKMVLAGFVTPAKIGNELKAA